MRVAAAWTVLVATGCSGYLGTARGVEPAELDGPGWIAVRNVPLQLQREEMDCGAAALGMVLAHWKSGDIDSVRAACPPDPKRGIEAGALRDYARRVGLEAYVFTGDVDVFRKELSRGRPVIVGMVKPYINGLWTHFEVVVGYHPGRKLVVTLDPAGGWRLNDEAGFHAEWDPAKRLTLVVFRKEGK